MIQVLEHGTEGLVEYMTVPIAFWVRERYRVEEGALIGPIAVDPPWLKDYDSCDEDRPDRRPDQYDVTPWGFFGADVDGVRVGAMILCRATPAFDLLEERDDMVHVVDFRVRPDWRGKGVGRALWQAAEEWSLGNHAIELRVETQDVNVPACRFYRAMGCELLTAIAGAYGPRYDEAQLIWEKNLES